LRKLILEERLNGHVAKKTNRAGKGWHYRNSLLAIRGYESRRKDEKNQAISG
jgi:hypothetical protein